MDIKRRLDEEMKLDQTIIDYCKDVEIATEFYSALCNMRWKPIETLPEDERIIDKLRGEDSTLWSCSWRYAGGIIAEIRNKHHNNLPLNEDYMDFYCSGNEGKVTELVLECFTKLGWKPVPWDDDII